MLSCSLWRKGGPTDNEGVGLKRRLAQGEATHGNGVRAVHLSREDPHSLLSCPSWSPQEDNRATGSLVAGREAQAAWDDENEESGQTVWIV